MTHIHSAGWRAAQWVGLTLLLLSSGACTTATVNTETVTKPAENYTSVALGAINAPDPVTASYVTFFREGFAKRIAEVKSFDTVVDPAPAEIPPATLLVSGDITEADKGSEALRFVIGFGAGRARVSGKFKIDGAHQTQLAEFELKKAYSGGLGIGGPDFLDFKDVIEKFGAETADVVTRWSRGKDLDDDSQ
jgi:hypothetical protein